MKARIPTGEELHRITTRAVAEIIPRKDFEKALRSGRSLRLKMGFDPSAPDLTLGHAVGLRKLRELQELGHTIVVIVGDWTARIGDPSGQSKTRPMLSAEEVKANAETYLRQFSKIVDRELTEVRWQSEWFDAFTLADVVRLGAKFTVAQMLEREDFASRFGAHKPIGVHELLYPLLQAYDSIAAQADVEFGGTDQTFNLLVGRELQPAFGQPAQCVFTVPILVGTDGKVKMSKSVGNYIAVEDPPHEMYGKLMSIPDGLIPDYLELLTDVPDEEVAAVRKAVKKGGAGAMQHKMRLAREIVSQFHGDTAAQEAEALFVSTFRDRELPPTDVPILRVRFEKIRGLLLSGKWARMSMLSSDDLLLERPDAAIDDGGVRIHLFVETLETPPKQAAAEIARCKNQIESGRGVVLSVADLAQFGLALSRLEARRLILQGGVDLEGRKVHDEFAFVHSGSTLRVGKHRFLRIVDADA